MAHTGRKRGVGTADSPRYFGASAKTALLRLLEEEYKLLGSRRMLLMLADDIESLAGKYFPLQDRLKFGEMVWFTTAGLAIPSTLSGSCNVASL